MEFPAKTAEQVVLAVKASLGFAETGLGKEILKAAGGEGPVPFSTITLASNVKSSQLAMVRGRTLRRVLLEKDQPIKGKGKDGAFRPVQMRNDDRIGYWTPDGWRDFPEATQEEMRLYLEVSGRAR